MSKGSQKRGQCDTCPATKRVFGVRVHGVRLDLCEACRRALSRIERDRAAEKARALEAKKAAEADWAADFQKTVVYNPPPP
jgi:hypothetical protein